MTNLVSDRRLSFRIEGFVELGKAQTVALRGAPTVVLLALSAVTLPLITLLTAPGCVQPDPADAVSVLVVDFPFVHLTVADVSEVVPFVLSCRCRLCFPDNR
jgi:hypothetical protein